MEKTEIQQLIHRFRAHDDHMAFQKLFGLYEKRIWILILTRNVPEANAGDVFQETCLALAHYLSKNKDVPENLLAVVYSIAKHKIADYFRGRGVQTYSLDDLLEENFDVPATDNPNRSLEVHEEFKKVLYRLGLNREQRRALILHYLMGYTLREIAELLGVPEETVKSRIYHGKRTVKIYMEKEREQP